MVLSLVLLFMYNRMEAGKWNETLNLFNMLDHEKGRILIPGNCFCEIFLVRYINETQFDRASWHDFFKAFARNTQEIYFVVQLINKMFKHKILIQK